MSDDAKYKRCDNCGNDFHIDDLIDDLCAECDEEINGDEE